MNRYVLTIGTSAVVSLALLACDAEGNPTPDGSTSVFASDTSLDTTKMTKELVSEFIAPGTAGCQTPAGRVVVSSWQQLAWRDLDSNVTTLVTLPYDTIDPTYAQRGDPMMGRLKDGTLIYSRSGSSHQPISPKPAWADTNNYWREVQYFWTSKCGDTWTVHSKLDAHDALGGKCAWPQGTVAEPWYGGWDRDELYVDPFSGAIYWSARCDGGSNDLPTGHYYRAEVLFRFDPDTSTWKDVWSAGETALPLAMTSTSNGTLFMLRCRSAIPELMASTDGGASWTVKKAIAANEGSGVGCRTPDPSVIGFETIHELSLARSGPDSVRVAYPDIINSVAAGLQTEGSARNLGVVRVYAATFDMATKALNIAKHPTLDMVGGKAWEGRSIGHFDFIEPDSSGAAQATNHPAILYWTELSADQQTIQVAYAPFQGKGAAFATRIASASPIGSLCEWRRYGDVGQWECGWGGDYSYGGFHRGTDGVCYFLLVWFADSNTSANNIHFAVLADKDC